MSLSHPSKRLLRAAEAERSSLLREHRRFADQRDRHQARADEAAVQADQVRARLVELAAVVGRPDFATVPAPVAPADTHETRDTAALSGPEVRRTAVRVLLEHRDSSAPIHYRDWYQLITRAGYAVAGKSPEAVFLTQISRSPIITKAPAPGTYLLDHDAPTRLQRQLDGLQAQLRDLSVPAPSAVPNINIAAQRRQLVLDINRTEREIAEATNLLIGPQSRVAALA